MSVSYICFGIRETDTGRFSVVAVYREDNHARHTGIRAESSAQREAVQHGVPYVGLSADSK